MYNIDLALATACANIDYLKARIERYKDQKNVREQKKYIYANIELEKACIYVDKLQNSKKEMVENINLVLAKYNKEHREVFVMYYVNDYTIEYIAKATKLSVEAIKKIVGDFDEDLIELYE